jgi:hypothetical protein
MSKERRDKENRLLGPKQTAEFMVWRRNRDKMIANPRRLKAVENEKPDAKDSSDQPSGES